MLNENRASPSGAIPHRFIVIEGPIGVGKTSLARLLAQSFGGQLILEEADQNPFLERFYKNPRAAAFQTQLFFLFQRARQLEEVRQEDLFGAVRVADYLLDKDRLFARVTLDDAEYALYERVYERVVVDAPKPDLVVYLQAPVDVLVDRIAKRGIRYEQHIERSYLEKLTQAYARFFHSYDASPLLIVNCGRNRSGQQRGRLPVAARRDQQEAGRPPLLQSERNELAARELGGALKGAMLGERPRDMLAHQGRGSSERDRSAAITSGEVGALPSATATLRNQRSKPMRRIALPRVFSRNSASLQANTSMSVARSSPCLTAKSFSAVGRANLFHGQTSWQSSQP